MNDSTPCDVCLSREHCWKCPFFPSNLSYFDVIDYALPSCHYHKILILNKNFDI